MGNKGRLERVIDTCGRADKDALQNSGVAYDLSNGRKLF